MLASFRGQYIVIASRLQLRSKWKECDSLALNKLADIMEVCENQNQKLNMTEKWFYTLKERVVVN